MYTSSICWLCFGLTSSNFSFSHNVFNSYISLVPQYAVLCGNALKSQAQLLCDGQYFRSNYRDQAACNKYNVDQNVLSDLWYTVSALSFSCSGKIRGKCNSDDSVLWLRKHIFGALNWCLLFNPFPHWLLTTLKKKAFENIVGKRRKCC